MLRQTPHLIRFRRWQRGAADGEHVNSHGNRKGKGNCKGKGKGNCNSTGSSNKSTISLGPP
jgi:hypothetical protein